MKVMIVAGGTGGHFYPGLTVARKLIAGRCEVRFIVRKDDFVIPLLERENIPFDSISAAGFDRKLNPKNICVVLQLIRGFFQSAGIIKRNKPDVLLVMGGYLSVPPAVAGKFLGVPVVMHEQNVKPGLANRLISRFSKMIALSFAESRPYFKGELEITGNPIRESFQNIPDQIRAILKWELEPKIPVLLVFGGSQGARGINSLVVQMVEKVYPRLDLFQILHFTGKADEAWVKKTYKSLKFPHYVSSYCHEMEWAYAASDLVLARAGASTITELIAVRKPAVLIPYPYATSAHQTDNARVLVDVGAALLEEQKKLTGENLKSLLLPYFEKRTVLWEMREKYNDLHENVFQAADNVCKLIHKI